MMDSSIINYLDLSTGLATPVGEEYSNAAIEAIDQLTDCH